MSDVEAVGTPEEYVAFMTSWVGQAGEELLRRVREGIVAMPSHSADGLRLLVEYMHAARAGFRRIRIDPRGFAQMVDVLAFDDRLPLPDGWPQPRARIRAAFEALGFTGDPGDFHPITYDRVARLVGHPHYKPRLMVFAPSLAELRHLDGARARIRATIGGTDGPVLIGERSVLADGTVLDATMRRCSAGIRIERSAAQGYDFASSEADSRAQELAAATAFAEAYNAEQGTDYTPSYGDDSDVDIVVGPLRVQVVRSSPSAAWESLRRDGHYSDALDVAAGAEEVLAAVRKKAAHYGDAGRLMLLIDGGITGLTSELLAAIGLEHQAELARAGFAGIWYASRVTGKATRLWPL